MISVCMATYNGEKYIKEQIDSILVQLEPDDELIISDDGSTDQTIDIIKNINDSRIKLFYFNSHCYTKNFENALKHASGDYIFLSDQDDIWLPNKVEVCMKYLHKYDFVVCDAIVVNSHLNPIYRSRNRKFKIKNGFIKNLIKTHYIGCVMAFNKKVLNVCLPFPENYNLCYHDAWIALMSEYYFKTVVINESLMLYRRHENNVSNGSEKVTNNLVSIVKIRLYLFINILKRKNNIKKSYRKEGK